jgi:hypothetical protein
MKEKSIKTLLYVTGVATMLAGLQFIVPTLVLSLSGIGVEGAAGLFYVRHWGLLAFCIGALIFHAARHPEVRRPILLAAAIEKAGLVLMLAMDWSEPALRGLHGAALFDGLCTLLYLTYLLRAPQQQGAVSN